MKINGKILSIPPHISTTWSYITALHLKEGSLAISLVDGNSIIIPNLAEDTIDSIFQFHARYLETEITQTTTVPVSSTQSLKEMLLSGLESSTQQGLSEPPFRIAFGPLDNLTSMMQHNPNQTDAPDLPLEVLQKISAITKILSTESSLILPTAEEECNCFHCQIARAIHSSPQENKELEEEVVNDKELEFQQWEIQQMGDNLYNVINRLDSQEKYHVYLGQPLGCTCGKQNCEHILAVLKT